MSGPSSLPAASQGFVSFVSSGPGDPELLTLKAVDRTAQEFGRL